MAIAPCFNHPPNNQIPIAFPDNIAAILYAPTKKWGDSTAQIKQAYIQFPEKPLMPCTILARGESVKSNRWTFETVLNVELIGQVACMGADGTICFKHLRISIPKGRLSLPFVQSYPKAEYWSELDLINEIRARSKNLLESTAIKFRDLLGRKKIAIQTASEIEILSFQKFFYPPSPLGGENHIHKHQLYRNALPTDIMVRFAIESKRRSLMHHRNQNRKKIYERLQDLPHCAIPRIIEYTTLGSFAKTSRTKFIEIMPVFQYGDMERHLHVIQNKKLPSIAAQMVSALFALHERSIVHRDIKLSNFLMHQDGVFLHDFDMAEIIDEPKTSSFLCGTAYYMSPDLILSFYHQGVYDIKPADDLWALGICLYRLQHKIWPLFFPDVDRKQKPERAIELFFKHYSECQHAAWWAQERLMLNDLPPQDKILAELILDLLNPDASLRGNAKTTLERLHVSTQS